MSHMCSPVPSKPGPVLWGDVPSVTIKEKFQLKQQIQYGQMAIERLLVCFSCTDKNLFEKLALKYCGIMFEDKN